MATNIISGFKELIPSVNLTTNGDFRVNQRANFVSSPAVVRTNDYICDFWKVFSIDVDYMTADMSNAGYIAFSGYGKRGQKIKVKNRDYEFNQLGAYFETGAIGADGYPITASCLLYNDPQSIPIRIDVSPRNNDVSGLSTLYNCFQNVKPGTVGKPVKILSTNLSGFNNPAYFEITLLADGAFAFNVSSFKEIVGAYRQLPDMAPTHYSDDLVRCERIYQVGNLPQSYSPLQKTAGLILYFKYFIPLRTAMALEPDISISITNLTLIQAAEIGNNFVHQNLEDWTITTSSTTTEFKIAGERSDLANVSASSMICSWVAEVA